MSIMIIMMNDAHNNTNTGKVNKPTTNIAIYIYSYVAPIERGNSCFSASTIVTTFVLS